MARTTRSSNKTDDATPPPPPPAKTPAKAPGKKRKRAAGSDAFDEQPAAKLSRAETPVKEETPEPPARGAADVPLDARDAERILLILESVDTQGLLDREFPLPAEALPADPQSSALALPRTYSFRALLKDAAHYPLAVLAAAVKPLLPVFSHPRSRPSGPAAQQLKFCTLARQLLDQASRGLNPTVGSLETLLPPPPSSPLSSPAPPAAPSARKYALVQRTPAGEWWSSLTAPTASPDELRALVTGHAELVAILPTPAGEPDARTLGDYARPKASAAPTRPLPGRPQATRRIGAGAFLDYGAYASFAPSFESDGAEIGRVTLGEVLLAEHRRRGAARIAEPDADVDMDAGMDVEAETESTTAGVIDPLLLGEEPKPDPLECLDGLLAPEQVDAVRAALIGVDLEATVQQLLNNITASLHRLAKLQTQRLSARPPTLTPDEEESALAESIHEALARVAALRPHTDGVPVLVPPAPALRALHRTLPLSPAPGWPGTLPAARATALHDDATIHITPGAPARAPATPATPAPATPAAYKPAAGQPAGGGYGYQYPHFPAGAGTPGAAYRYTPAQGAYYGYAQQGQGQAAQTPGAQAYAPYGGAGGQTQYYSPQWYGGAGAQRAVANTVTTPGKYAARAAVGTPAAQWGQ